MNFAGMFCAPEPFQESRQLILIMVKISLWGDGH